MSFFSFLTFSHPFFSYILQVCWAQTKTDDLVQLNASSLSSLQCDILDAFSYPVTSPLSLSLCSHTNGHPHSHTYRVGTITDTVHDAEIEDTCATMTGLQLHTVWAQTLNSFQIVPTAQQKCQLWLREGQLVPAFMIHNALFPVPNSLRRHHLRQTRVLGTHPVHAEGA